MAATGDSSVSIVHASQESANGPNSAAHTNGHATNGAPQITDNNHLTTSGGDIAIIGLAARFAGEASSASKLWDFILSGRCAAGPVPADRFSSKAYYHPDSNHAGTTYAKGACFLKGDPAAFDAPFFTLGQSDVLAMDPQQRILLENAYQALENAGISMEAVAGSKTSVFVGSAFTNDFLSIANTDLDMYLKYKSTGTSPAILANRISWFYDLKGASMTVDTACSSSLTAFHQACLNLKQGESEMALVSGVNLIMYPAAFLSLSSLSFLSPDGKCYSFDHRANGYGRGEGVGTMILKPLAAALRDGDTIRAVVKATGTNQDGRTPGITLPSATAQEALIKSVYAQAGLDLDDTMYVEAHGTGTQAGDPLEAEALAHAFNTTTRSHQLYIGSIKASVGHTEGAAGIAGLIKATLALESGTIPPAANFEKNNPKIPFDKWNIQLPTEPKPWPSASVRQASVNSFGFGGANAHVVLQNAGPHLALHPVPAENGPNVITGDMTNGSTENGTHATQEQDFIVIISSADEQGIIRQRSKLAEHIAPQVLQNGSEISIQTQVLKNLAYTISCKRPKLPWKSFCVAGDLNALSTDKASSWSIPVRTSGHLPKIGFVFTGQGAQWAKMGEALLQYSPFRDSLMAASKYMGSLGLPWVLIDELVKHKKTSSIDDPFLSQCGCTALQIALVDLLATWNILPTRVVGHSSGEIAAAYACGKLCRSDAWKVAYYRGYVSQKQTASGGAMLAAGISSKDIEPYIRKANEQDPGVLVVACLNSPKNITVSGDKSKIDTLLQALQADNLFARKLKVLNAYHSPHMLAAADEYRSLMGELTIPLDDKFDSSIEMISSVTGATFQREQPTGADYWVENLVSPVRFSEALKNMCLNASVPAQKGKTILVDHIIEIGPHPALRSAIRETLTTASIQGKVAYSEVLNRGHDSAKAILLTAGSLYCSGHPVDLEAVNHKTLSLPCNDMKILTNLPPYEFNHSKSYWTESRLSRNLRHREHPRHDLFGAPVLDWNASEPKWKNYLRRSELPWIMHHRITQNIIYPGVGYLIMALEASKQVAFHDQAISAFRFRNVSLKTALIVPETDEGIEVSLSFRPASQGSMKNVNQAWNFNVFSFDDVGNEWVEHCTGSICVEYESPTGPVDAGRAAEGQALASLQTLERFESLCQKEIATEVVYGVLHGVGMEFGPTFKNLDDVKMGDGIGQAMGTVTVPDVTTYMPKSHLHQHTIQPSTMDSMLHIFLAAIMDSYERSKHQQAMVPTFMQEVWISAATASTPGSQFLCHGQARPLSTTKWESQVSVWDSASRSPRVMVKRMQMTPLGSSTVVSSGSVRNLCHNIQWDLHADLLLSTEPIVRRVGSLVDESNVLGTFQKYQLASSLLISDALAELQSQHFPNLPPNHQRYTKWLEFQNSRVKNGTVSFYNDDLWRQHQADPDLKRALYEEVARLGTRGELLMRMGPQIAPVMCGKADALELMFQRDDLMQRFYNDTSLSGNLQSFLGEYLSVVRHNHTNLKILEVGAGTGSATKMVLEALAPLSDTTNSPSGSTIESYAFTDISMGFFEKAKERFDSWSKIIDFKTLDIEADPAIQGYQPQSFDFIVAANVLHATADIAKTLKNVQSLLKEGGKLILMESTATDHLWSCLCFGLLPGWWLSKEAFREWGPLMNESQWNTLFQDNGFESSTLVFKDTEGEEIRDIKGFVVSAAPTISANGFHSDDILIVSASLDQNKSSLVKKLGVALLENTTDKIRVTQLSETSHLNLSKTTCIVISDLEQDDLSWANETNFQYLQHLLCTCGGLLWVSQNQLEHPRSALMTGLLRSVRWERDFDDVNFVTLELDDIAADSEATISCLLNLYDHQFRKKCPESKNGEFKIKDGQLLTNRLMDANDANEHVSQKTSTTVAAAALQPYGQDTDRALKLTAASPGMLNRLEFVDDELWSTPMGENDVEISIRAVSLNFLDIMVAMGEILDTNLGIEGAGIVSRVGSAVQNFKVGDHVVGFKANDAGGAFRSFFRTPEAAVVRIPGNMRFEDAAALPGIFCTVIYGLLEVARLSKGEKILIHAGAGGTGQAAIQIAQQAGAEVFVTVSTLEKRKLLKEHYGIPEDHVFSSRDLSFASSVMTMTGGRGVDVVLNSLAGEALRATWKCLAPFGRFIELGKKDALTGGSLEMAPFLKNVTYAGVNIAAMMYEVPLRACKIIEEAIDMFMDGKIRTPYPLSVYNFSQIELAFRQMQSGKASGKIVFCPNADDVVPVVPGAISDYHFHSDASYVLAGGLGGIGRSLATWMVSRGAKNLIFLSRSGATNPTATETITNLTRGGSEVKAYACDVSQKDQLRKVLEDCTLSMPPIKGCIQAAMVLQDSMFSNMSYKQFTTATLPKVQGSSNLIELLPQLDFFVMLSSITGIVGNRGQANYAAGNVYQDTLAKHLTSRGVQASSIDLGNIMSVGYVAEREGKIAVAQEWEGISEDELHALIEYHIDSSVRKMQTQESCQTVTGIIPSTLFAERGIPQPAFMRYPLFNQLHAVREATDTSSKDDQGFPIAALLGSADSMDAAAAAVAEAVAHKMSAMMSIPSTDIDCHKPLHSYGVDSLVAVEIRNWLGKEMQADVPVLDILSRASILDLSMKIASQSKLVKITAENGGEAET